MWDFVADLPSMPLAMQNLSMVMDSMLDHREHGAQLSAVTDADSADRSQQGGASCRSNPHTPPTKHTITKGRCPLLAIQQQQPLHRVRAHVGIGHAYSCALSKLHCHCIGSISVSKPRLARSRGGTCMAGAHTCNCTVMYQHHEL